MNPLLGRTIIKQRDRPTPPLHRCRRTVALAVLLASLSIPGMAQAQYRYRATDLGDLGFASARALNNDGTVVGASENGHLLIYDGEQVIDAGIAGAAGVDPFAVNDVGQVVGALHFADGTWRAFSYIDGTFSDLGTLPGDTNSRASDINDDGIVVGVSWGDGTVSHGFVYRAGTMTDIGTLGGDGAWPMAINGAGDIVGKSAIAGSVTPRAFLFQGGAMRDLGAGANTVAFDINDSGAIVGGGFGSGGKPGRLCHFRRSFARIGGVDTTDWRRLTRPNHVDQ